MMKVKFLRMPIYGKILQDKLLGMVTFEKHCGIFENLGQIRKNKYRKNLYRKILSRIN